MGTMTRGQVAGGDRSGGGGAGDVSGGPGRFVGGWSGRGAVGEPRVVSANGFVQPCRVQNCGDAGGGVIFLRRREGSLEWRGRFCGVDFADDFWKEVYEEHGQYDFGYRRWIGDWSGAGGGVSRVGQHGDHRGTAEETARRGDGGESGDEARWRLMRKIRRRSIPWRNGCGNFRGSMC